MGMTLNKVTAAQDSNGAEASAPGADVHEANGVRFMTHPQCLAHAQGMDSEQLAEHVTSRWSEGRRTLRQLKPYLDVLWDEFDRLEGTDTIAGCRTKEEYCKKRLGCSIRAVQHVVYGRTPKKPKEAASGNQAGSRREEAPSGAINEPAATSDVSNDAEHDEPSSGSVDDGASQAAGETAQPDGDHPRASYDQGGARGKAAGEEGQPQPGAARQTIPDPAPGTMDDLRRRINSTADMDEIGAALESFFRGLGETLLEQHPHSPSLRIEVSVFRKDQAAEQVIDDGAQHEQPAAPEEAERPTAEAAASPAGAEEPIPPDERQPTVASPQAGQPAGEPDPANDGAARASGLPKPGISLRFEGVDGYADNLYLDGSLDWEGKPTDDHDKLFADFHGPDGLTGWVVRRPGEENWTLRGEDVADLETRRYPSELRLSSDCVESAEMEFERLKENSHRRQAEIRRPERARRSEAAKKAARKRKVNQAIKRMGLDKHVSAFGAEAVFNRLRLGDTPESIVERLEAFELRLEAVQKVAQHYDELAEVFLVVGADGAQAAAA